MTAALVVVGAEVGGRPGRSVRLEAGRIVAVGSDVEVDRAGADVLDAAGGAVIPGLHDHHLHLLAFAARLASVDLDHAATPAVADAALADAAAATGTASVGWVRAGGYDEHRHGRLDRTRLDAAAPGAKVRVQHRSGLSWVLSTAGLQAVGIDPERPDGSDPVPTVRQGAAASVLSGVERGPDGAATGWLHRLDDWLGGQVGRTPPDLAPVGARLAALGVTGVTDTTPVLDDEAVGVLRDAAVGGCLPQRLVLLGRTDGAGLTPWARLGPVKLVADEHAGLDPDAMAQAIATAHRHGRRVAVHCVTRAECVATVAALLGAGPLPGDRLEHASVLPPEIDPVLAANGVVVVTQPAFVHERGDHYLAEVDSHDRFALYRHASLRAAGVVVALSSDAPVGSVDPWVALRAGRDRRTRSGAPIGAAEAVAPLEALDGYLRDALAPEAPPRGVAVGAAGDLCVLRAPLPSVDLDPTAELVRATIIDGRIVHG